MNIKKKKKIVSFLKTLRCRYINSISFKMSLSKGERELLKYNSTLKNCLAGRRCFIIGNGPSVRKQNLGLLKDEIVFTVNQSARQRDFKLLHSNFHFWTDPNLFVVDDSSASIVDMMRNVNSEGNTPICFFPIKERKFIQTFHLDSELDIRYISPHLGWLFDGFNLDFDLCRHIPQFGTVVQFCIVTAIYMGVKEIYLLGCDNTGIINSINSIMNQADGNYYGYDVDEIEKIRMEETAKRNGLETEVNSYLYNIRSYRILDNYCKKRDISIYNCSANTVIDSIRRLEYEEVIKEFSNSYNKSH